MGVFTITEEFTSPLPAKRIFSAFMLDIDNLLPKVAPIKSVEIIQGNGGPGTIKKITFADGKLQSLVLFYKINSCKYLKHRVDVEDKDSLKYKYTVTEGDALADGIEAVGHEVTFQDEPNGGCKGTHVSNFYPKAGVEIKEEQAKADNAKAIALFKAVEAYLIANPQAYA
ncbi:hypothetical protein Tsubulata_011717 [Turnera subulata]|uniref:Bet v I/Major latex protein domain-containing protein n=1 Tax=Turnera subulata TaxID=218843 RepID=A0A9Q0JL57_9ROSI|nr:hypothetical protein Tsubulata_011717 [Turnera subulata]